VEVGRTVQLHVRDAQSADEDLRLLLEEVSAPVEGALLFTCNGRGSRLFPAPSHDVQAIEKAVGQVPVAGFFCAGEIGPVGGRNFLHGFTASVAFFG
jgi:small ligand-binding sensory domain FIST